MLPSSISLQIIDFAAPHWPRVEEIYQQGIDTGITTNYTCVPSLEKWLSTYDHRFRWVAVENTEVIAWCGLTVVNSSCVDEGALSVSIYVHTSHRNKGIGGILLQHAINQSEAEGYWTLEAGIAAPNYPSIRLHHKYGFRYVGTRDRILQINGQWQDMELWERRSAVVGL